MHEHYVYFYDKNKILIESAFVNNPFVFLWGYKFDTGSILSSEMVNKDLEYKKWQVDNTYPDSKDKSVTVLEISPI